MQNTPLDKLLTHNTEINETTAVFTLLTTEDSFLQNIGTGISNTMSNILKQVKGSIVGITKYMTSITDWIGDQIDDLGTPKLINTISLNTKRVDKDIKDVKFQTIANTNILTIQGMQTRLIFTNTIVNEALLKISKEYVDKLDKIDYVLSKFISDDEVRKSFRKLDSDITDLGKYTDGVMESIKEQFDTTDLRETRPFYSIIGNLTEYKNNLILTDGINKNFGRKDLSKLLELSTRISGRLDIITEVVSDGKLNASKESIKGLITTADNVSKYLTVISALYFIHTKTMEILKDAKLTIKK